MVISDPFSQETLNKILKLSPIEPDKVISRESSILEFKSSFGWKSLGKYMKTSAAFANTSGGYIFLGITDSPRKLIGLSERVYYSNNI